MIKNKLHFNKDISSDRDKSEQYTVKIWEVILIILGAIGLFGAGLSGLGAKLLVNMFEPERAETIAKSLIDYQMPSGSEGVAGMNVGAEKFAIVKSNSNPPDLILSVSKTPIGQAKDDLDFSLEEEVSLQENINGKFVVSHSSQINKFFCDRQLPVTAQYGKQTLSDSSHSLPAIQYSLKTTKDNIEYVVSLLAIGTNAQNKVDRVFSSFKCKF
jgi:hypothetical protein